VPVENVLSCVDVPNIYEVPLMLHDQAFDLKILEELGLPAGEIDLTDWQEYSKKLDKLEKLDNPIDIAVVGKYVSLPDAYLSVIEALGHASVYHGRKVNIHLVDGEILKAEGVGKMLSQVDGVLIPGGFGLRAFEGKVAAVQYARENNVPFFGICLGLQTALCEFARNVAGMEGANSTEFASELGGELAYPVIDLTSQQEGGVDSEERIRLGAYPCKLVPNTKTAAAYGETIVYERHQNRYDVNNAYIEPLAEAGLVFSGRSPDDTFVEMIELANHPWFVACQGHPEFKSRPTRVHPLFRDFIGAALQYHEQRLE